tara:strand:- start:87 stop:815 length:729 start_codon:yes stop_codon:yes gene_type:complete
MNQTYDYSLNFSLPKRSKKRIKFVVLHYTGMKNEFSAIRKLQNPKFKVSTHYLIKKNGEIITLVPDLYEAWHAGLSSWKNYRSLNKNSIGIEITNPGHQFDYRNFSKKQIYSLEKLLKYLIKKYQIKKENILGHSDVSPNRKKDPGEKFPWQRLAKKRLAWWHNLNQKKIEKFRKIKILSKADKTQFIKNLYKIGYSKLKGFQFYKNEKLLTKAFQRRFRQDLVDGKIDKECLKISENLLSQ